MSNTIVVCGHGPGISHAVARRFGRAGFRVAIAARSADKLEAAAKALRDEGIDAKAYATDLGDVAQVKALIEKVGAELGDVTVLHWNAYSGAAGNLLTCDPAELRQVLSVGVEGLVAAVQVAVPQMKGKPGAAVLVTGGGFSIYDENVDRMIVQFGAMGLGVSKAAQHKLTNVLRVALSSEGIFVGEATVLGLVKGTAFDSGHATLEPSAIAEQMYAQYEARSPAVIQIG
jgi:NADP-dependent 3-hydroxy acid dehydrogenase YdfG